MTGNGDRESLPDSIANDAFDRAAGADKVETQLNTLSANIAVVNGADRGNQPRREWVTTGVATPVLGADPLPGGMTWTPITGHEMDRYWQLIPTSTLANLRVGTYPTSPPPANRTYYFRYRFNLAPTVDPATCKLRIAALTADDRVVGAYLNGKRLAATQEARVMPAPLAGAFSCP